MKKNELDKIINSKIETGILTSIRYSRSGDMNGNIDTTTLNIKEKTIITNYKAIHSDPLEVKKYKVSDEDINSIIDFINKYNLPAWSKLPSDPELYPLDAPSRILILEYDNSSVNGSEYESYSIDIHTMIFPKDTIKIVNDLINQMKSLIKEENLLKEYIDKE